MGFGSRKDLGEEMSSEIIEDRISTVE